MASDVIKLYLQGLKDHMARKAVEEAKEALAQRAHSPLSAACPGPSSTVVPRLDSSSTKA